MLVGQVPTVLGLDHRVGCTGSRHGHGHQGHHLWDRWGGFDIVGTGHSSDHSASHSGSVLDLGLELDTEWNGAEAELLVAVGLFASGVE